MSEWEILHAVGGGLLRFEPASGSLVPGVATGMPEVSDEGRTYTFDLRDDVEFPDGTLLDAPLYVDGVERAMRLGGRGSDLISLYVSDVEAPDDTTVVFRLRDAYSFFPTLVAGAPYLALHPDAYPQDELAPMPETPIYGAGPWYIESFRPDEIVLEENPEWADGRATPSRIVVSVFETTEEMADALVAGAVDLIWRGVDSDAAEALSNEEGITVAPVEGGTLQFLTVNHATDPTNESLVRQAIAQLVDRGAVIDATLDDRFEPAYSPIPPSFLGATESFRDVYGEPDIAGAIDLLRQAGATEEDPVEIELAYPPERFGLDTPAAMDALSLQMESTGLAAVTITAEPWNTYVGSVVDGSYDLALLGWLHDYPDPHNYLAPFVLDGGLGGSGQNLGASTLVDLVGTAAREADPEERASLYSEAQSIFAEEVVTIPLWIEHPFIAYRDEVSGDEAYPSPETLNVGASMLLDFRSIELEPGG